MTFIYNFKIFDIICEIGVIIDCL